MTDRFVANTEHVTVHDTETDKHYPVLSSKTAGYMAWKANRDEDFAAEIIGDSMSLAEVPEPQDDDVVWNIAVEMGLVEPEYLATLD